jgi:hypothetical protein
VVRHARLDSMTHGKVWRLSVRLAIPRGMLCLAVFTEKERCDNLNTLDDAGNTCTQDDRRL